MFEARANIAQLEFLLYTPDDLQTIISETISRAKDGQRNKIVVRIFDTDDVLTAHVQKMQVLRIRSDAFYTWLPADFCEWPFWRRWPVSWNRKRLAAKQRNLDKSLVELGIEALRQTIKYEGPIGIEDDPRAPFRLVRHAELYELLEACSRAQGIWVFIFEPNELLADKNTVIVYAI